MVAAGSYSSLRVRSTDSSLPQTIQLPSTLFMPWVPPLPEEEGGEGEGASSEASRSKGSQAKEAAAGGGGGGDNASSTKETWI